MVALARTVEHCCDGNRAHAYLTWLRTNEDEARLREIREHHALCVHVIDARLGELRPICWDRRQWSDLALSVGFAGVFLFWMSLIGWIGQCVWSWLAD